MTKTRHPLRLLHLEDSPRDAELITHRLEAGGVFSEILRVDDQKTFEEALMHQDYDLVLCDYNLPGYDGSSALRAARKVQPHAPVIIISGSIGEEEAVECLHLGATDYLLKNRLERLVPAVKRALKEAVTHREQRRAEEQLRESEERFRQLAEQSSEGFWFVELNPERILYVSPALERIWARPAEYYYQHSRAWIDTIHPDDRVAIVAQWTDCLEGRADRFESEYRIIRPDQSVRWVLGSGVPIRDEQGRTIRMGGVVRDITERKQIETKMLRTQRLESIGTLAGGIAHDLNNTLLPILMSASMLRLRYPDETEMIDAVETGAKRAANMVRQLLTFAKGIDGARLLVHSQHLLVEMEKIIRSTFPKNIALRLVAEPFLDPTIGDATQLHQALLNLCVNARDAMPRGGTLTLEVENTAITAEDVVVLASPGAKPGRYVAWHVRDTGSGISQEIIDRIFEPFFSTKGPDKGTGLGLSTVVGIIKSHGGFVRVDSIPDEGSTFSLYLPAKGAEPTAEPSASAPEPDIRGKGETILVVDDEVAVRNVCNTALTALNFQVITAADGTEALALVAENREKLRAVITDMHMPNMDGINFVSVLKRMLPRTEIIVTSGHMEEREAMAFSALGVHVFLDKPFTQQQLMEALSGVLY